ncbi:MAG: cytochrome c oxidase subunit 3 [Verrucomicrobia bacterium]|nr:cytochrome c oxidase subunit 3 [Verrucomicrobiota bacterium]
MKHPHNIAHEAYPDTHHDTYSRTIFGFWLYLMSDFILFGALFATYIVLSDSTFGGPSARELFQLPFTFVQTLVLLLSTLTVGLAGASAHRKNRNWTIALFSVTFVLGIVFLWMQLHEFAGYLTAGNGWKRSAFLSGYFTLVGTHTLHVLFGLLWMIVLIIPVCLEGISHVSVRRLTCMRMFWQFLNIVWVFIFSFVYLLGAKIV